LQKYLKNELHFDDTYNDWTWRDAHSIDHPANHYRKWNWRY
jgi:hypothetical protein